MDSSTAVRPRAVEFWCVCSDAGSDVKATRDQIISETAYWVNKLLLEWDCSAHQWHLVVFALLFALDTIAGAILKLPFKMYSALAQVCHLWRDNVGAVAEEYSERLVKAEVERPAAYLQRIKRVPPRPIAGRWGRSFDCIRYILEALEFCRGENWPLLRDSLVAVFKSSSYYAKKQAEAKAMLALNEKAKAAAKDLKEKEEKLAGLAAGAEVQRKKQEGAVKAAKEKLAKARAKAAARKSAQGGGGALDETAQDDMRAYEEKMGKWARGGVQALSTAGFLLVLLIGDVILERLSVFLWTVKAERPGMGNLAYLLYHGGEQMETNWQPLRWLVHSSAYLVVMLSACCCRLVVLSCAGRVGLGCTGVVDCSCAGHQVNGQGIGVCQCVVMLLSAYDVVVVLLSCAGRVGLGRTGLVDCSSCTGHQVNGQGKRMRKTATVIVVVDWYGVPLVNIVVVGFAVSVGMGVLVFLERDTNQRPYDTAGMLPPRAHTVPSDVPRNHVNNVACILVDSGGDVGLVC